MLLRRVGPAERNLTSDDLDRRRFLLTTLKVSAAALFGANPGWGARHEAARGSMKITRLTLYVVNVPERKWWWSDDFYGQPEHQRDDNYIVEVETDQGLAGLTRVFRSPSEIAADLPSWIGRDVMAVNLRTPGVRLRRVRAGPIYADKLSACRGNCSAASSATGSWSLRPPDTRHPSTPPTKRDREGFRVYKMKCITHREGTDEKRIRYVVDRVEAIHKVVWCS